MNPPQFVCCGQNFCVRLSNFSVKKSAAPPPLDGWHTPPSRNSGCAPARHDTISVNFQMTNVYVLTKNIVVFGSSVTYQVRQPTPTKFTAEIRNPGAHTKAKEKNVLSQDDIRHDKRTTGAITACSTRTHWKRQVTGWSESSSPKMETRSAARSAAFVKNISSVRTA